MASRKSKLSRIQKFFLFFISVSVLAAAAVYISYDRIQEKAGEYMLNKQADSILEKMSDEEKAGQLFIGCFYDGMPDSGEIEKYHLGGAVLFKTAFENKTASDVRSSIEKIHDSSMISPVIAVDEEGGTVTRISCFSEFRSQPFDSPRNIYDKGGLKAVTADTHEKNELLLSLGIDMNMAPICDITLNSSSFMYSRSLGRDADTTSDYVRSVVKICESDGIACVLKHFPRYGETEDTHESSAVDDRPLSSFEKNDFLPFKAGIEEGAPAVLFSHSIVPAIDEADPASLSEKAHDIIREDMGFDGIILTDDLSMDATSHFRTDSSESIAVSAFLAGNDMLCTGDFRTQYGEILAAVKSGRITEERLDTSVRRIIKFKLKADLITDK